MKGVDPNESESGKRLLVFVIIVLLATGFSPRSIPQVFAYQDKLHHVIGFFAFAWAMRGAFPRLGVALLIATGVGAALAIELVQAFEPRRTASAVDALSSIFGLLLGLLCHRLLSKRASPPAADAAEP